MDITAQFLVLTFSILIFSTIAARSDISCKPDSCHSKHGPTIRFPFRLEGHQLARCGYPGFDLRCNSRNQTILNLPQSGNFVVNDINYQYSYIHISDPGSCLPKRALNLSLSGSPYNAPFPARLTFLNCTRPPLDGSHYSPLHCLSEGSVAVWSRSVAADNPPSTCRIAAEVRVPLQWDINRLVIIDMFSLHRKYCINWMKSLVRIDFMNLEKEDFELGWSEPECGECEEYGGICGFKNESGLEIGCTGASFLPRSVELAIIAVGGGFAISGLLYISIIYVFHKIETRGQRRSSNSRTHTFAATNRKSLIVKPGHVASFDVLTTEPYPNPKRDDVCPICLCEYKSEQVSRSVLKCNHHFHTSCVNEWLKLKGNCPLCRRSLRDFSTPVSSSSTSSPAMVDFV